MLRDARVCARVHVPARVIRNVIVGFLHRCQEANDIELDEGRGEGEEGKSGEKKVHGVNRERLFLVKRGGI